MAAARSSSGGRRGSPMVEGAATGVEEGVGSRGPAPSTCTPPAARRPELPSIAAAQSSSGGRCGEAAREWRPVRLAPGTRARM